MKILESQNALLSNFEVYQHMLNEQHKFSDRDRKKKVPRSVQALIKEVGASSIPFDLPLYLTWEWTPRY